MYKAIGSLLPYQRQTTSDQIDLSFIFQQLREAAGGILTSIETTVNNTKDSVS